MFFAFSCLQFLPFFFLIILAFLSFSHMYPFSLFLSLLNFLTLCIKFFYLQTTIFLLFPHIFLNVITHWFFIFPLFHIFFILFLFHSFPFSPLLYLKCLFFVLSFFLFLHFMLSSVLLEILMLSLLSLSFFYIIHSLSLSLSYFLVFYFTFSFFIGYTLPSFFSLPLSCRCSFSLSWLHIFLTSLLLFLFFHTFNVSFSSFSLKCFLHSFNLFISLSLPLSSFPTSLWYFFVSSLSWFFVLFDLLFNFSTFFSISSLYALSLLFFCQSRNQAAIIILRDVKDQVKWPSNQMLAKNQMKAFLHVNQYTHFRKNKDQKVRMQNLSVFPCEQRVSNIHDAFFCMCNIVTRYC